METISFASDNYAGVHPKILETMAKANKGHVPAYGNDSYTKRAVEKFREFFGKNIEVYFALNGTAANVLGLASAVRPFNSIICAGNAHLYVDECAAPEKFMGCKLIPVEAKGGKLTVEKIKAHMHGMGFVHSAQPRAISITQATEYGTVYSAREIKEIADYAHKNNCILHMDGARICNAAASLGCALKEITVDAGVDVLSFGGTKNGMMYGEAIVFCNPSLAKNFGYVHKQGMQLASKMRYIAAQFEALLSDGLWLENAAHSNKMAKLLEEKVCGIRGVEITQKVQSNAVFAALPKAAIGKLLQKWQFYDWDESKNEVRWMASFDTTEEDVQQFAQDIKKAVLG